MDNDRPWVTDFSRLLGADRVESSWYLKTPEYDDYDDEKTIGVDIVSSGWLSYVPTFHRVIGARPAVPYSVISADCSRIEDERLENKGYIIVEYGEYPQTAVSEDFARTLESAYSNGTINQTGKNYTTDSIDLDQRDKPFKARNHMEYEYNGKKYIRIVIEDDKFTHNALSGGGFCGRQIQIGQPYWIEVQPIYWFVDEKANIALSESVLFAGVQFNNQNNYEGNFDETDIKKFMDEYFSKDIIPSLSRKITAEDTKVEERKKELEELKKELLQQPMEDLNQQEKFNR